MIEIALVAEGRAWRLPDDLLVQGLQIEKIDGVPHLGRADASGYYDPPLCGAQTTSRNVTRVRDHRAPTLSVCSACVAIARPATS